MDIYGDIYIWIFIWIYMPGCTTVNVVYMFYNYYYKSSINSVIITLNMLLVCAPTFQECNAGYVPGNSVQTQCNKHSVFNSTGEATGAVSHPTGTGGYLGMGVRTRQTHSNTSPRLVGFQIKEMVIKKYEAT